VDKKSYIANRVGVAVFVLLAGAACAKISAPTGGPRDTDPPVILKSQPENGTVMFTARSFSVTFDEYVVLDKITDKFMVSPPLATKPVVKLKGRDLVVTWDEELADSTTYTFYFQDAIRDNNESNPIPNYQYVFSTGPVLDSLTVTGNIFNASDLETAPDMLVMMYSNLSDTAPRTLLPAYISRPDLSGGFAISNVKPGRYRLFAVNDLNGNKRYDLDNEMFAFYDSVLVITPDEYSEYDIDSISYKPPAAPESVKPAVYTYGRHRIYAFLVDPSKQYLKFAERKSSGSISFGLALPSDSSDFSVKLTDVPPEAWIMETNVRRDTFRIWITADSVYNRDFIEALVTYPFTDSTGTDITRTDTVSLRFQKPAPTRGTPRRTGGYFRTNLNTRIRPGTIPWFEAQAPMNPPDTSKITLKRLVDSVAVTVPCTFRRDSLDLRRYFMNVSLLPGVSYTLSCSDSSFSDIYGSFSDSTVYKFSVATREDYGNVTARLTGYEGAVIVQLLGDREKVVKEAFIKSPGKAVFDLLDKGKYRLKVIYDTDGNRVWTTGSYIPLTGPEAVTYYNGELDVKINWELEQDWDISLKNRKDVSLRSKPEPKR
jgi:hypothetical protein